MNMTFESDPIPLPGLLGLAWPRDSWPRGSWPRGGWSGGLRPRGPWPREGWPQYEGLVWKPPRSCPEARPAPLLGVLQCEGVVCLAAMSEFWIREYLRHMLKSSTKSAGTAQRPTLRYHAWATHAWAIGLHRATACLTSRSLNMCFTPPTGSLRPRNNIFISSTLRSFFKNSTGSGSAAAGRTSRSHIARFGPPVFWSRNRSSTVISSTVMNETTPTAEPMSKSLGGVVVAAVVGVVVVLDCFAVVDLPRVQPPNTNNDNAATTRVVIMIKGPTSTQLLSDAVIMNRPVAIASWPYKSARSELQPLKCLEPKWLRNRRRPHFC